MGPVPLKILVVGDWNVGKSSIIVRYTQDLFSESQVNVTPRSDVFRKTVEWENNTYSLSIVDTAGQERFRTMTASFYHDADCVLLVFDLTASNSLQRVAQWVKEIHNQTSNDTTLLLVGNKCDLWEQRVVSLYDLQDLARQFGVEVLEISAKENENVSQAFEMLLDMKIRSLASEKADNSHVVISASSRKFALFRGFLRFVRR